MQLPPPSNMPRSRSEKTLRAGAAQDRGRHRRPVAGPGGRGPPPPPFPPRPDPPPPPPRESRDPPGARRALRASPTAARPRLGQAPGGGLEPHPARAVDHLAQLVGIDRPRERDL